MIESEIHVRLQVCGFIQTKPEPHSVRQLVSWKLFQYIFTWYPYLLWISWDYLSFRCIEAISMSLDGGRSGGTPYQKANDNLHLCKLNHRNQYPEIAKFWILKFWMIIKIDRKGLLRIWFGYRGCYHPGGRSKVILLSSAWGDRSEHVIMHGREDHD